jgi:histone arginine demethylase JMJD6
MQDPQIPSALWFSSHWYKEAMDNVPGAIEILQKPGETVYVPCGWPHLVLNLGFSTAITHNYATEFPSFKRIHQSVQEEEPEMVEKWEAKLEQLRPELLSYEQNSDSAIGRIVSPTFEKGHTASSTARCAPESRGSSSTTPVSLIQ